MEDTVRENEVVTDNGDKIDVEKKTFRTDSGAGKDDKISGSGTNNKELCTSESTVSNHFHPDQQKSKDMMVQQPNIMNFEEDEFADQSDAHLDHGPFQDFEKLKTHPAHTAVFMNFVFHSHDPCALLLILTVEQYRRQVSSMKEMVKSSDHISKTYITPTAILKVGVDEGIAKSIADAVQSKSLSEEALRSVFDPAVQHALKTVKRQLEQFCKRKEQGMGNCFGADKIIKGMDQTHESKAAEEIINPLLQDLGQPQAGTDDAEILKNAGKIEALEKILMQWTGKRKSKITSRIGSMLRANKPNPPPLRPRTAGSMDSIIDEQNKRTSILGKWTGKKTKPMSGTASLMLSTVIPVVHTAHPELQTGGEGGNVSQMVNKFQDLSQSDGSNSTLANVSESKEGLYIPGNKSIPGNKKDKNIGRSGSFRGDRRHRSATGKSSSDPDAMAVETVLSENSSMQMSSSISNSSMASTSSMSNSQTSASLSSITNEDLIAQLVALHPELDVKPEYQWSQTTPKEVIKQVERKEQKRQEIISELLHTEEHHVRDLRILDLLFYSKMQTEGGLTQEELFAVFPNLQEILELHKQLKTALTDLKTKDGDVIKDISHVLLKTFDGIDGEKFKNECAKYCGNQTAGLEFIKERCRKDQKFNSFIQSAEKHPICRRLQLKDFVPIEFQRLTKYPLLLENIIKNTKNKEEASKLRQIHKQCKAILSYVNKAVKDAEDHQKIVEIQKNLDASSLNKANHPIAQEYKNINLMERKLVHQGPLTWRITLTEKKKAVVLHCVLFDDIMVLLQKQDERYVLKCHTSTKLNSSKDEKSTVQPPILKLSKILVRNNASDKRSFYLVSTSEYGAQIYELVAMTAHDSQEWLKLVSLTAEAAKKKDISTAHARRSAFMIPETSRTRQPERITTDIDEDLEIKEEEEEVELMKNQNHEEEIDGINILEKIKRKHLEISAALVSKHNLLATYAGIESSELENILEITLEDADPEPETLVLHLLTCTKNLTTMLNDALSADTVFLPPTAPPVLIPTAESIDSENGPPLTPTPKPENDQLEGFANEEDNSTMSTADITTTWTESESREVDDSEKDDTDMITSPSLEPLSDHLSLDQQSNASLEMLASDYETASEPGSPSPSSAEDNPMKIGEEDVESGAENVRTSSPSISGTKYEEAVEEQIALSPVEVEEKSATTPSDAGIGMSESREGDEGESDNTLSAIEMLSTPKLVSPIAFDDLLDFGSQAIAPNITVSTSPSSTAQNMSSLMGHTSTIDVTKMLEISYHLESQLMRLLQTVKETTEAKRQVAEENSRLISQINEMESKSTALSSGVVDVDVATTSSSHEEKAEVENESNTDAPPSYSDIVSDR